MVQIESSNFRRKAIELYLVKIWAISEGVVRNFTWRIRAEEMPSFMDMVSFTDESIVKMTVVHIAPRKKELDK